MLHNNHRSSQNVAPAWLHWQHLGACENWSLWPHPRPPESEIPGKSSVCFNQPPGDSALGPRNHSPQ